MYQNVVRQIMPVCLILAQLLFITGISFAEEAVKTDSDKKTENDSKKGFQEFAGINFGVGLALTFKHGENRVESASVQESKVQVYKTELSELIKNLTGRLKLCLKPIISFNPNGLTTY